MGFYGEEIFSVSEDTTLLEYSGKEATNKEFREVLDKLKAISSFYTELCPKVIDMVKYIFEIKIPKNDKEFDKWLEGFYKKAEEYNNWQRTESRKLEYAAFKRFQELSKKFCVKYSDVIMEDRKKYYDLFEDDFYKVVPVADYLKNQSNFDKVNDAIGKIQLNCGQGRMERYYSVAISWLKFFYNVYDMSCGNIAWLCYHIDKNKDGSLKYKIVQKLLKSKPKKED